MRVLYHHRTLAEDGQAVHIRALQQALREEGHEVHEVSLVQQGPGEQTEEKSDASAGRSRWSFVSSLPRLSLIR